MARLNWWIAAVGVACLAIAIAYLPPRGAASSRRGPFFEMQAPQLTAARLRAQGLADQWRAADGAVRMLSQRRELRAAVQRRAALRGPLVLFTDSARVPPAGARLVDSAVQAAWRGLGLGETKVRVALVIELTQTRESQDRPAAEQSGAVYLAPDSTDRTTCVAFVPAGPYWTRAITGQQTSPVPFETLVGSFQAGLGPCAFYAAFGTPSRPVRGWLVARQWDVALNLDAGSTDRSDVFGFVDARSSWYWDAVYRLPTETIACVAGRPSGCRAAVLAGASDTPVIPVPDVLRPDRRWWRTQHLVAGQRFLADVFHEVGRERFMTFWTSTLPVDTALTAALKHPVGEWTAQWQRRFIAPVRLGPAVRPGAVFFAICIGALAVCVVALTASRRQVR